MKLSLKFGLIASITFLSLGSLLGQGRGMGVRAETTLPWHTDAEAAFAESRETGRPVLAVFR
ncbi:MAG: hypothetical protein P1U85_22515 [Verrucomicrobiales bacterium]|nr:hypothetical protein [Verrucomicrobiales bacterium]